MSESVKIGVIGCGNISGAYFGNAKTFSNIEVLACADLNHEAAKAKAEEFSIPKVLTVDELLADREIEIVINLTVPQAHVPMARRIIESGKHTYAEKPLGLDRREAKALLDDAAKMNLRVGCAPDTFLGTCVQTARKAVDDGLIGRPVAGSAFMMGMGPEPWHPNPEFFYEIGGGPMFDMGPYYLTALFNILGPLKRLASIASIAIPERTIGTGDKAGNKINVKTPDHIAGTLEFANGTVVSMITSFATNHAIYDHDFPITIYGTEGAMRVGDPNGFDGKVQVKRDAEWEDVDCPFMAGYGRIVGVADMANAIRTGRRHRASGEQAFHTLDAMQGFLDASATGEAYVLTSPYDRPDPMPLDLPLGTLD